MGEGQRIAKAISRSRPQFAHQRLHCFPDENREVDPRVFDRIAQLFVELAAAIAGAVAFSAFLALSDAVASCGPHYPYLNAPATAEEIWRAIGRARHGV